MQNGPAIERVEEDLYREGEPRAVQGQWKIEDIYRDLTQWLMHQHGRTRRDFASEVGYSEATIKRFLRGKVNERTGELEDHDMPLEYATRLAAWANLSHLELLQLHPVFKPGGVEDFKRATMHARLLSLLTATEATALVAVLEAAKQRGMLELVLESIQLLLRAADSSQAGDPHTPVRGPSRTG